MLLAIINHGLNAQALALKNDFGPLLPVLAIDSGSALSSAERAAFDLCLPNVYYAGCLRAAAKHAIKHRHELVWIWASDVRCANPELAVRLCTQAFENPDVAVYAPSATYSFHRQMAPRGGEGLRRVTFTDGFCFALRSELLWQLCEDFSDTRYGFGMDVHAGYLARRQGQAVVVDHRHAVAHPQGAGYSVRNATAEWKHWLQQQSVGVRLFHRLARKRLGKSDWGMRLLLGLPWASQAPAAKIPACDVIKAFS